jgi:hypothetical protein
MLHIGTPAPETIFAVPSVSLLASKYRRDDTTGTSTSAPRHTSICGMLCPGVIACLWISFPYGLPSNSTSCSRHDTLYPSSYSSSGLILSLILSQIAVSAIPEWFAEIFIWFLIGPGLILYHVRTGALGITRPGKLLSYSSRDGRLYAPTSDGPCDFTWSCESTILTRLKALVSVVMFRYLHLLLICSAE